MASSQYMEASSTFAKKGSWRDDMNQKTIEFFGVELSRGEFHFYMGGIALAIGVFLGVLGW